MRLDLRSSESSDRGSPSTALGSGVGVRRDTRMTGADRAHRLALGSDAAPVDEANLAEAGLCRLLKVAVHHGSDVAWGEGVEIDGVLEGDMYRGRFVSGDGAGRTTR